MIESAPMADLSNSRNAGVPWLIGALLGLSLAVVVPIHLNHRFFPTSSTVHAGLRVAHHTVVDQIAGRLEARIDRTGRAQRRPTAPPRHWVSAIAAPGALPRATSAPPQTRH